MRRTIDLPGQLSHATAFDPAMAMRGLVPYAFVYGILALTVLAVLRVASTLPLNQGNWVVTILWLLGFGVLIMNVAYMLLTALVARFCPPVPLPEVRLASSSHAIWSLSSSMNPPASSPTWRNRSKPMPTCTLGWC